MRKLCFLIIICFSFKQCSSLYYYPSKNLYYSPDIFGFKYESHMIDGFEGTKLNVWRIYSPNVKNPKGVVLQFHGNGENMSSHFLSLAWLVNHGYELITYDYRGYGKSEGESEPEEIFEDSKFVLDFALKHTKNINSKLIVYGQSLGGAVAMRSIADWPKANQIQLICVDGSFTSYREVVKQTLNQNVFWPMGNIVSVFFHDATSPRDYIQSLPPIPIVIIHGTEDSVVFFKNGQEIFKLANEPKVFLEIRGGGHVDWMGLGQSKFAKDFLKLLDRHLY
ncbi:alpha/beta hydrolase [Leptospira sp. 96542]|nr:alpha/beta hydrolase [Leptospira sp. 96542]